MSRKDILPLLYLNLILILVCLPGFNRGWISLDSSPAVLGDAAWYIDMVLFFRGQPVSLTAPWSYRPLIPFLASFIPLDPLTSINLINLASLMSTTTTLYILLPRNIKIRLAGGLLFIVSGPVLYHGMAGYIDPGGLFFVTLGFWALKRDKPYHLLWLLPLGILAKESVLILVPIGLAFAWQRRNLSAARDLLQATVFAFLLYNLWRLTLPGDPYAWRPNLATLSFNLSRPETIPALLVGFGLPSFLALILLFRQIIKRYPLSPYLPQLIGIMSGLVLTGFALVAAYADMRFPWLIYPFALSFSGEILLDGRL